MSALLEKLADELARDTMEHAERLGDNKIIEEVGNTLADTSVTFQEAFLTAVRFYRADMRARQVLPDFLQALPGPDGNGSTKPPPAQKAEDEVPIANVEIVDDE